MVRRVRWKILAYVIGISIANWSVDSENEACRAQLRLPAWPFGAQRKLSVIGSN